MSDLKPALSAEEWERLQVDVSDPNDLDDAVTSSEACFEIVKQWDSRDKTQKILLRVDWDFPHRPLGIAAALLYFSTPDGQPYFTHKMLGVLREVASRTAESEVAWLAVDRLAALLPPEAP